MKNSIDELVFCKIDGRDTKSPVRAHEFDAGIDIFAPNDMIPIRVEAQKSCLIKTGLRVNVPEGYALIVKSKSGVATKKHFIHGACVDGDVEIRTDKGIFKANELTKKFMKDNNILVESFDVNNMCKKYNKCDGFRCSGTKECVKLTFEDGSEMICSEDHKILTRNGWKEAININEDDDIIHV